MSDSTVAIVTGNTKKYKEMAEALSHHRIATDWINADVDEVKSLDAEVVIRDKALKSFNRVQKPILVDDSGIYFDRYTNFPGTYSKFLYQAIGYDGIFQLVKKGDSAVFRCFVGYMDEKIDTPQIFHGEYPGTITDDFERTESEMPYALFFVPNESGKRMCLLSPEERKNDHRHQALNAFAVWYSMNRR